VTQLGPMISQTSIVLDDVRAERVRQDLKLGPSAERPSPKLKHLVEEVGEVAAAMQDESDEALRTELVQVAAVAVAMVEAIDRGDVPRQ
jgi:NTP pyrophosphatase (non-canonical NTP hydrolase)